MGLEQMNVSYANDSMVIMWPEAMEDSTPYDIKQVVSDLLAIRTAKDVLDFILKTPPSFFSNITHRSTGDWVIASDFYESWVHDPRICGSIVDLVEKDYPEIEPLDGFATKGGDFGPYIKDFCLSESDDDDPVYADVIYPTKPYCNMLIGSLEALAFNLQEIARIGAIANGELSPSGSGLDELPIDCDVRARVIDSKLSISHDLNRMPAQDPTYKSYFTPFEVNKLEQALEAYHPRDREGLSHLYNGEGVGSLFVYPEDMSEQEMAANIFMSFMNSLFEGNAETMYSGNIFKVRRGKRGFVVVDNPGPLRDMYRQCARFVASGDMRLCAYCGKPLLADRSRGNEAMYCSRTCNTKASAQRREMAYALAASGVPVEDAIERIGTRYERSIRRWYEESQRLLD